MRFMTDSGGFGLLIAPTDAPHMFRFQLVMDGQLVGDTDPCFLDTAMKSLRKLPHLDDTRLSELSTAPEIVLSLLLTDEDLHDRATLPLAESMDRWLVHGYHYDGQVVMIAYGDDYSELKGPALICVIETREYDEICNIARIYWSDMTKAATPER